MSPRTQAILLPAAAAILALSLWAYVHTALPAEDRFLLPAPNDVIASFVGNRDAMLRASMNTALVALLGFSSAVVLSTLVAVLLSASPLARLSFYPYLLVLQMTPIIVFAPMLVLWVGPGLWSVVCITSLVCLFPMATNTCHGLLSVDRGHIDLFRTLGATRAQELLKLRLPSALPSFFTGLRISATLAPIGALVGDYTAGSSAGNGGGLGFLVIQYHSNSQSAALLATAGLACLLGFAFVGSVSLLSWLSLHRWHEAWRPQVR